MLVVRTLRPVDFLSTIHYEFNRYKRYRLLGAPKTRILIQPRRTVAISVASPQSAKLDQFIKLMFKNGFGLHDFCKNELADTCRKHPLVLEHIGKAVLLGYDEYYKRLHKVYTILYEEHSLEPDEKTRKLLQLINTTAVEVATRRQGLKRARSIFSYDFLEQEIEWLGKMRMHIADKLDGHTDLYKIFTLKAPDGWKHLIQEEPLSPST